MAESIKLMNLKGNQDVASMSATEVAKALRDPVHTTVDATAGNHADDNAALATITAPVQGDTAVVTRTIVPAAGDTPAKVSYTAYVFNGTAWAAMDGNYDARNVYMGQDITYTTNVGYLNGIDTTTTKKNFDCDGLSVFEALKQILSKTIEPTAHNPSYSLAVGTITTDSGTMEMGSKVTKIAWNGTWTDGQYKLDGTKQSDAGCTPTYSNSIDFVNTNSTTAASTAATSLDGTYVLGTPITIASTSATKIATIKSDCTWTASTKVPTNNLGESNSGVNVGAGEDKGNSADVNVTGFYYGLFFGGISSGKYTAAQLAANPGLMRTELTAKEVSGYSTYKANTKNKDVANSFKFVAPAGTKTIVFAYKGTKTLSSAFNDSVFAEMNTSFDADKATVKIPGYGDDEGTNYTVWTYSPTDAYGSDVKMSITLK